MELQAGTRFGPYELVGLTDRGGMGQVFKALDTRLDRPVALKLLPPEFLADPARRARFEREARLIARLQHPHICTLFDVGVTETPYLVLEYIEGQTLAERLAAGALPQLPPPHVPLETGIHQDIGGAAARAAADHGPQLTGCS